MPPPAFPVVSRARPAWLPAVLLAAAVGTLLAGCGGELVLPDDGRPASIEVIAGGSQSGEPGDLLAPVIFEVTDAGGQPVKNASVVFQLTVAADGAEIVPPTTTTDSIGRASARMLLGTEIGIQTAEARVMFGSTPTAAVPFSAVVEPSGPPNRAPRADYNWHCEDLTCQFTDASRDDDGSVTTWSWQFGDGRSSGEQEPAHTYEQPGTYTVILTVADNRGATDDSEAHVDVDGEDGD